MRHGERVYRGIPARRGARAPLAAWIALACGGDAAREVRGSELDGLDLVRVVDGSQELARARIADGSVRACTRTPDREESWPYWSASAWRLVFQAAPPGRGPAVDLILWDPDTDSETPLFRTPNRAERWPAWAPRGARLVSVFRSGRAGGGVAIADLERRTTETVAEAGRADSFWRPRFDRDGARLVVQRGSPRARSKLWTLSPGARPRPLTVNPAWFDAKASFTRDEIAFVSDRDGGLDVFLSDLSGARVRPLTRTPARDEFAPRWSPDGERLVVTSIQAGERADLSSLGELRCVVLDRDGRVLLDVPGSMADWMPPW